MEKTKRAITFYKKRTFSETLSATFDFTREAFKPILLLCVKFILPLTLIQAIFFGAYMKSFFTISMQAEEMTDSSAILSMLPGLLTNWGGMMLFSLAISGLITAIAYTILQRYNETGTVKNMPFAEIKSSFTRNFTRTLIVLLVFAGLYILLILATVLSAVITPFLLIVTIPALIASLIALYLLFPTYLFEPIGIGAAILKAFRLGFKRWGGFFLVLLVTGILAGIIQTVAALPWSMFVAVKSILALSEGTNALEELSLGAEFFNFLSSAIMLFVTYCSFILVQIGTAFHYGSAREEAEGITFHKELDHFEEL